MSKQIKHVRISKSGKKFIAGGRKIKIGDKLFVSWPVKPPYNELAKSIGIDMHRNTIGPISGKVKKDNKGLYIDITQRMLESPLRTGPTPAGFRGYLKDAAKIERWRPSMHVEFTEKDELLQDIGDYSRFLDELPNKKLKKIRGFLKEMIK